MNGSSRSLYWPDMNDMVELMGKEWPVNGAVFRFANEEIVSAGYAPVKPWVCGSEAIAYPLENVRGKVCAFAKFFNDPPFPEKRIRRTQWLIDQEVHTWTRELRGAPRDWLQTSQVGRPSGVSFDFACAISEAVPGRTWLELKEDVAKGGITLDGAFRKRCVENLLRGLVLLERRDIVHGDLSENNVIVNVDARSNEPALYLIDFDGFVGTQAGELARLTVSEGGTYGTDGYHPLELEELALQQPSAASPFSDRFGRDALIVELLSFSKGMNHERPASQWDPAETKELISKHGLVAGIPHLRCERLFELEEDDRASSYELAREIGLAIPPRVKQERKRSHALGELGNTTFAELFGGLEIWLRKGIILLWLLCVVHIGLVAFWFTSCLFGVSRGSVPSVTETGARLLVGAQLFLTAGAFLGGLAGLSMMAFAEREPRLINVVGLWFRIPARGDSNRDELTHHGLVAGKLAVILAALSAGALLLVRL